MTMRSTLRTGAILLSAVLIAVVVLSFTGHVFAPGDSLAVIRFPAGLLLLVLATALALCAAWKMTVSSFVAALVALVPLGIGYFKPNPPCTEACLTLYQKNLMSKTWPRDPLTEELIASDAEIVTLQEVSDHNRRFMAPLFDHYRFSKFCPFRPEQDVAVLTSLEVIENTAFCLEGAGMAAVQVLTSTGRPLWAVSVHLEWPFPFDQFQQTKRIEARLKTLDGPILIGGDFNMVTWGGSVRRLSKAAGNTTFGPYRNTHQFGQSFLPLPIDNVLVPNGAKGHLERRPRLASDHMGLLARIVLP